MKFLSRNAETIKKIFGGLILLTAIGLYFHAEVGLKNKWLITSEKSTSESNESELALNFIATHVYLVANLCQKNTIHQIWMRQEG